MMMNKGNIQRQLIMRLHPRTISGIFCIICCLILILIEKFFKICIFDKKIIYFIIPSLTLLFYSIYEKFFYKGD